jgi:hypothetical protein
MMDSEKKTTLRVVIFLYSSRFVTSMHLFPERDECWIGYILLWILYLYLFVIHNLRDFFLKLTNLFSIKFLIILSQCEYHSDVIFGLWSMDIDWQVPSLCTDSSLRRHQQVQHHSNTRSSCAITLKIKPTTMSWRRCCFKKKSRKLCITNKYKYKIHNKIYPIQHSLTF